MAGVNVLRELEALSNMGQNRQMARTADQVSVVIACHTQERMSHLLAAIDSVENQELKPESIVITVDHEPVLHRILSERFPNFTVVENKFARGASGNRNTGAACLSTPIIAFLDDDARARPGWLSALVEPFHDPQVICAGGFVAPAWEGHEPKWFPEEFGWVVGVSHRGLPTSKGRVRNVWSENMAVRRDVFDKVGGFRSDFGKVGGVSRPEDTDLCIRMGKAIPGAMVMFVPDAVVDHHVGQERTAFGFFLKRCYFEGRGKVELARHNEGAQDLEDEQRYLRRTIPSGIAGYVRGAIGGDFAQMQRAGAMVSGLGAAAFGGVVSMLNRKTLQSD